MLTVVNAKELPTALTAAFQMTSISEQASKEIVAKVCLESNIKKGNLLIRETNREEILIWLSGEKDEYIELFDKHHGSQVSM